VLLLISSYLFSISVRWAWSEVGVADVYFCVEICKKDLFSAIVRSILRVITSYIIY